MKLSVVIVNYNVQYFLENCLISVFKAAKGIELEVFVVDNNSVDGSVKMVKEKFPAVKLIENKENLGFSKANNQAIKKAGGQFILLLNPDTVVEEDTFKCCLNFFEEHEDAGGLGVKMLDGKGTFLPESKRGLPTPAVAFYKIFGLSQLFPKSKKFGQYHLGYLSKNQNHAVEVLSGAFMMIRKEVLDQIGLLDENFFMYGEDIDLSYRITQANYKNYYLSDTSIIHYKGESTKKSSINYVFVFYRAMAIFAKKHFSDKNAKLFSTFINIAIYLRAGIAVLTRTAKHIVLPLLDALLLVGGIVWFMNYYEANVKKAAGQYYPEAVDNYGIPIMVGVYLLVFLFSGAYSIPTKFKNVVKGAFSASLVVLIVYSLLDESYRFSRAIVLFSVVWTLFVIPAYRLLLSLFKIRVLEKNKENRIAIVGKENELKRIDALIKDTLVEPQFICYINAGEENEGFFNYTAKLYQLEDIIEIYKINEVIFCSKDVSSEEIIRQMAKLSSKEVDFKIAPPESLYIIGSNSNQHSGEYYVIGANALLKPVNQRNKRILDISLSLFFLLLFPIFIWLSSSFVRYFSNLFRVLSGSLSFVGFAKMAELPDYQLKLKRGIFVPSDQFRGIQVDEKSKDRINFEYGRDYSLLKDLEIVFKNLSKLDSSPQA
ncbi:MAG: glycosyltransferase [Vicingaceae bacterium]